MNSTDTIVSSALSLPPDRRAELAVRLLDSLADSSREQPTDSEVAEEVQRRSAELDSGEVVGIPWAEARAFLRSRIAPSSKP